MTIEVTQEDIERGCKVRSGRMSKRQIIEEFAHHRQAAYEQGVLEGAMQAVREMRK